MTSTTPAGPWTPQQLRIVIGANVAALVVLIVAWDRSGGTATLNGQITWLNVAVVALVLSMTAHGALVFIGRRAVGRRRRQLLPDRDTPTEDAPIPVSVTDPDSWLWTPGTRRAHRPSCPLATGKPATVADEELIRRHSLLRCEVCG